jgi:DNA repair protein RadA/Sms
MAKTSTRYVCQSCGYEASKWMGKCPECGAFSTFSEESVAPKPANRALAARHSSVRESSAPPSSLRPQPLSQVTTTRRERLATGMAEFDRVLGGGLVPGSLVLIGGDPGIGKSTLLIEAAVRLAEANGSGLYFSGEESAEQIRLRAERLELRSDNLFLASETDVLQIEAHIRASKPAFAVVDSIQTMLHPALESAPGTLTQVRESANVLQRLSKDEGVPIFIVGHVNKEGNLAGPRALEHLVDAVLQLEGDEHGQFRILRAAKNRFGSTNELGVFEMTEAGMRSVENPSELFLSERQKNAPGSVVVATVEGARPLLVEVQALCSPTYFSSPRRTVTGADMNRLLVVLAVIEKRLGLRLGDQDVYVNVAGGLRVTEPAVDLGIALAVISSLRDEALPAGAAVFGEIGLGGEVRSVPHIERRVAEAVRLGFAQCLLPQSGASRLRTSSEFHAHASPVSSLMQAVSLLLPNALARRGRDGGERGEYGGGRRNEELDSELEEKLSHARGVLARRSAVRNGPRGSSGTGSAERDYEDE